MLAQELKLEYEERKLKNPSYSLRAFARHLSLSPSALSEIMRGIRAASPDMVARIGERLMWQLDKVNFVQQGRQSNGAKALSSATFNLISEWHYFAILSLAETTSSELTPEFVRERLGVTKSLAAKSLKDLVDLKFLDEKYRLAVQQPLITTEDIPDVAVKRNHVEGMSLAEQALFAVAVELREFSATTVALDPAKLNEIKMEIRKFRMRLEKMAKGMKAKSVYRLNIQLFPLTKEEFSEGEKR